MTLSSCLVKTSRPAIAKREEDNRTVTTFSVPEVGTTEQPESRQQVSDTTAKSDNISEDMAEEPLTATSPASRARLIPLPRNTARTVRIHAATSSRRDWLGHFLLRQSQTRENVQDARTPTIPGRVLTKLVRIPAVAPTTGDSPVKSAVSNPNSTQPARDRRAFPRRHSGCKISVVRPLETEGTLTSQRLDWLLHSTPLKGHLTDISMNGIAFSLAESLKPGEEICLRATGVKGARPHQLRAEVVRSTQDQDPNHWNIQCRLQKKLDLEAVQELGQNLFTSNVV